MKKLVLIDCCIRRQDSRTRALAKPLVEALSERYEVAVIDLTRDAPVPVTEELFRLRGQYGLTSRDRDMGALVAGADRIVIAAPFWDMSFPAALKTFMERISACGVTFADNPDGTTRGICKAEKLLYITTRGMEIPTDSALDAGTPWLRAMAWLWGIGSVETVAAWGMDVCAEEERSRRLQEALQTGLDLCREF
jgi:FMN-dependent NADH-azoreductase